MQRNEERNRLKIETMAQYNFREKKCPAIYKYLLKNKKLMHSIGFQEKYNAM